MIKIETEPIRGSESFQTKGFKNFIVHFNSAMFTLKQNSSDAQRRTFTRFLSE